MRLPKSVIPRFDRSYRLFATARLVCLQTLKIQYFSPETDSFVNKHRPGVWSHYKVDMVRRDRRKACRKNKNGSNLGARKG
jgi:hypothetical protein